MLDSDCVAGEICTDQMTDEICIRESDCECMKSADETSEWGVDVWEGSSADDENLREKEADTNEAEGGVDDTDSESVNALDTVVSFNISNRLKYQSCCAASSDVMITASLLSTIARKFSDVSNQIFTML